MDELSFLAHEAVEFELFWDEVSPGDGYFVLLSVAGDLDDLHAVFEWPGDGGKRVGGRDEQDLKV